MSTEATLTSKGQTTIPKPIRDSLAHEDWGQNELHVDAGRRCSSCE
jgi:bifunctional DNA-binding transcriptional regulator/antitoxin component of YhaV-PrlF toxin-antitoxin module